MAKCNMMLEAVTLFLFGVKGSFRWLWLCCLVGRALGPLVGRVWR